MKKISLKTDDSQESTASIKESSPKKAEKISTLDSAIPADAASRANGVRIQFKDSGSILHVGYRQGELLVQSGRAEYV